MSEKEKLIEHVRVADSKFNITVEMRNVSKMYEKKTNKTTYIFNLYLNGKYISVGHSIESTNIKEMKEKAMEKVLEYLKKIKI